MDPKRKKQLLEEYKNRCPEMGVISFLCKETKEIFLGASIDTKASFNSNYAKLSMNYHPNKRMQELWNQYGSTAFEFAVLEILEYENPNEDHREELELMCEEHLEKNKSARRIWR